jgi:hypothetical protein
MRQSRQPARCRRLSQGRGRPEGTRLPGEHGISRPTTAQGRPSDWLHLYAAVRSLCATLRAADRGCRPAPGLPCALLAQEGGATKQSSGELRRENARVCLQFEMRTGRATPPPHTPSLRAQRSNPESLRGGIPDCFAALAMTVLKQRASHSTLVPRTQCSATSAVRCRAGAHLSALSRVAFWVPALRSNAKGVAARPGHERERGGGVEEDSARCFVRCKASRARHHRPAGADIAPLA